MMKSNQVVCDDYRIFVHIPCGLYTFLHAKEALRVIQGCEVYKIIFAEYSIAVRSGKLSLPAA